MAMAVHPTFLLWSTQPHPQKVRRRFRDSRCDFHFFLFRERAKRRRICPRQHNSVLAAESPGQFFCDPRRAPEEKVTVTGPGLTAEGMHQVGTVHATFERVLVPPPQ